MTHKPEMDGGNEEKDDKEREAEDNAVWGKT